MAWNPIKMQTSSHHDVSLKVIRVLVDIIYLALRNSSRARYTKSCGQRYSVLLSGQCKWLDFTYRKRQKWVVLYCRRCAFCSIIKFKEDVLNGPGPNKNNKRKVLPTAKHVMWNHELQTWAVVWRARTCNQGAYQSYNIGVACEHPCWLPSNWNPTGGKFRRARSSSHPFEIIDTKHRTWNVSANQTVKWSSCQVS